MSLVFQNLFDDSYTVANTGSVMSLSRKVDYFKYSWLLPIALVAKDARIAGYNNADKKRRRKSSRRSKKETTTKTPFVYAEQQLQSRRRSRLPVVFEEEKKEEYGEEESKDEYSTPVVSVDFRMLGRPPKSVYGSTTKHHTPRLPSPEESKEETIAH
eukprot:scaffold2134_cov93-Cylindrotheca_fusiformis.AAC.20